MNSPQTIETNEQPKELYLVWQGGEDEQFYSQYTSLTDAVSNEDKDAEILKADLTSLGTFELVTKVVKKKSKGKK